MSKAQLTLETIIMLVVLLVLAGVMITLILNTLKPPSSPEKVLSKRDFLLKCESYCNDPEKIGEYCSLFWNGNDWNENKVPNELIKLETSPYWYACEDRIYCFLIKPCERLGSGRDLIRRCKDVLCGIYLEKYEDVNAANQALMENIVPSKNPMCKGNYERLDEKERWYKIFEEGCGASPTPSTPTTTIPTVPTPPSPPPSP
jgi:hypothetical protein